MNTRRLERTKLISLRLKPAEHRWLLAEAARMYVPLSAYLRHRLFGQEAKKPRRGGRH